MTDDQQQQEWKKNWQEFRDAQSEVVLANVCHIPVTIRYIDVGPGTSGTILLMHGIPTWGFLYHQVIPFLVEEGYRVIAPDFLGHGWSDRRDRFDRSFQDQAKMILALLEYLKIDNSIHVVGHDTGGAVALILAIEHAHVVDRLVISNAVCYDRFDDDMLDFGHPVRWKNKSVDELVNTLEESLEVGIARPNQLTLEFREGIIAPWASEEGKLSLIRNAAALNANQTMALVDRHATIKASTLLLWSVDDPWQKYSDGERLATEIPGSILLPIENVSHWVPQDAPQEFATALMDFFGSR